MGACRYMVVKERTKKGARRDTKKGKRGQKMCLGCIHGRGKWKAKHHNTYITVS